MHICHVSFKPELWMTLEDIQRVHIRSRTQFYCCPWALWNAALPQSLNNRMQSDLRSSKFPCLSSPSPVFIHGSIQSTGFCWKAYLLLPKVLGCLWGFWGCKCLFSAWRVFFAQYLLHSSHHCWHDLLLLPASSVLSQQWHNVPRHHCQMHFSCMGVQRCILQTLLRMTERINAWLMMHQTA